MSKDKVISKTLGGIRSIEKQEHYFYIDFETGEKGRLSILNDHVFRYYMSPSGTFLDYPTPINPEDKAKIIKKEQHAYGYIAFNNSKLNDAKSQYVVQTKDLSILFDKISGTMKVHDARNNSNVFIEFSPLSYSDNKCVQTVYQRSDEYFFGGGMQNGRFTHKGEVIDISNTNNWDDGGVSSPCPFYWSTYGYGILRNTWQPGCYDFGANSKETISTSHQCAEYYAYFFINLKPRDILKDYYELTGSPLLLPEYAYYEAHLNAFNRDYWVEVDCKKRGAILFEDGKYYKSYKPNEMDGKTGILESLNGENNNYQFSARAMIDRYKKHDMPLGWFIPNDGYGSGYGQTSTLDGDIENLKEFSVYAKGKGVNVALWTESNLEPADPLHPKKGERDLGKEVGVADVVALKCDVAWIGDGYSFALSAVENASNIFVSNAKNNTRSMIIMVDGWAGTQRFAGIWSGDQRGGEWEYIRFHIPTYIGSGLSGIPIVGSDMDGIYAGGLREVNIRDYQWKTFTPLQLNMDGWGNIPKTPFSFDTEATKINRAYLKLKSMLLPYNYSLGQEAINGLPMVRAMFLEFPDESEAYTKDSQYQFMWGPSMLIAPIFNEKCKNKDSIRDGVFLPDKTQVWIDFFTGEKYQGGKIYNNLITPLWKIPVFIRDGSIIPMVKPNNNPYEIQRDVRIFAIYPNEECSFSVYEDDGISSKYLDNHYAFTEVEVVDTKSNDSGNVIIKINKTRGTYTNMVKERTTLLQVKTSKDIEAIKVAVNGEKIEVVKAKSEQEFDENTNCYYYHEHFVINSYMQDFSDVIQQKFVLIKVNKLDVTSNEIYIKLRGYTNKADIFGQALEIDNALEVPQNIELRDYYELLTSVTGITMNWTPVSDNIQYYEIEKDGFVFSNIINSTFTFENLIPNTEYIFKVRTVSNKKVSHWSQAIQKKTLEDPLKFVIKGVQVTCNLPCQRNQEVINLTNEQSKLIWHTDWTDKGKAKPDEPLKLHFDLGEVYDLAKFEYVPRDDAGNGTFLEMQYRFSIDNDKWSPISDIILFIRDNKIKTIPLEACRCRYIEIIAGKTVGDFGSGKYMLFYKK